MLRLFLFIVQIMLIQSVLFAQEIGLHFVSYEGVQDERTGLDLTRERAVCYEKELSFSFDIRFRPNQPPYYGYIFRLFLNDTLNIDLVNEDYGVENGLFSLIIGDEQTTISISPTSSQVYQWLPIHLQVSNEKGYVSLRIGDHHITRPIALKKPSCAHVQMGASRFPGFSSSDVPPIYVKDIRLQNDNTLYAHWLLGEEEGDVAIDQQQGLIANVRNPVWLRSKHKKWMLEQQLVTSTAASVAFNQQHELLYLVGQDDIKIYDLNKTTTEVISYSAATHIFLQGNQSIYVPEGRMLYNYYPDAQMVAWFDWQNRKWSDQPLNRDIDTITAYWHTNKFYSLSDSSLYIVGGYGYRTYKNQVYSWARETNLYEERTFDGTFEPRYLAGLGMAEDGAYMIGGYGSSSGKQAISPKYFYDLHFIDVKNNTIRKVYDFSIDHLDVVFANSLVIGADQQVFYGLVHPKDVFETQLRLVTGSLVRPGMSFLGDSIPYPFHDIKSFSDLYFAPQSEKLIAVTLFDDGTETKVHVYSIKFPVLAHHESVLQVPNSKWRSWWWIMVPLVLLLVWMWYRSRKGKREPINGSIATAEPTKVEPTAGNLIVPKERSHRNAVLLFGYLQIVDRNGKDITKRFTPVVRELFLAILLYTVKTGRGVSSETLYELIWGDKTIESARNNRSVNTAKLKSLLKEIDHIAISKETGYWKLEMDPKYVFIDYATFWQSLETNIEQTSFQKLSKAVAYLQRGAFLEDLDYPWLDDFKSEITNVVLDLYLHMLREIDIRKHPESQLQLASYIVQIDPMNEEAMTVRCIVMVGMGLHSQAQTIFHNFKEEYRRIYGEAFQPSFKEVLSRY